MKKQKINLLGYMDSGTGKHQSNCVYSVRGVAPALCSSGSRMRQYTWILIKEMLNYNETIYFGNIYGLHDGYDGSVFSPYGICKTITASIGGIADILVEYEV